VLYWLLARNQVKESAQQLVPIPTTETGS
jgi:hypothetical protein